MAVDVDGFLVTASREVLDKLPSLTMLDVYRALLAVAAVSLCWIFVAVTRWLRDRALLLKQMPCAPGEHLIIGHADLAVHPKNHVIFKDLSDKLGPIYYVRILAFHGVMVSDPDLVHALHARPAYPKNIDRPDMMRVFSEFNSPSHDDNLLSAPSTDPLWKLVRRGVSPAFNAANIRHGFDYVVEVAERLVRTLKACGPEGAVNIDEAMERESMDVIGLVGFGKDFDATSHLLQPGEHDVFHNLSTGALEITFRMMDPLRKFRFWQKDVQAGNQAFKNHHKMIGDLVKEVQARGPPKADDMTIAAHLMRIRDEAGRPLPTGRLQAEFSTMFGAGTDTTGHSMAWTLFLVSQHPQVEAAITAELEQRGLLVSHHNPSPRKLVYSDLAHLPYLSAVIKESMRMYTVVGVGPPRVAKTRLQLGDYTIPAGTLMWPALNILHNSARNWQHPEKFMPERFLESGAENAGDLQDDSETAGATKRFLPFGDGIRNCVGQSLARMNLTAALAILLSHLSFRLADKMGGAQGVAAKEVFRLSVLVDGGLWMHCLARPLS
eukprot:jgi/Botrbrau1/9630/Bobra.0131s0010.1